MEGELTKYRYEDEAKMVAEHQKDYDAGRVHFRFDEEKGRWRKFTSQ